MKNATYDTATEIAEHRKFWEAAANRAYASVVERRPALIDSVPFEKFRATWEARRESNLWGGNGPPDAREVFLDLLAGS